MDEFTCKGCGAALGIFPGEKSGKCTCGQVYEIHWIQNSPKVKFIHIERNDSPYAVSRKEIIFKCPQCGVEISKSDWRCQDCLYQFSDEFIEQIKEMFGSMGPAPKPKPKKKSPGKKTKSGMVTGTVAGITGCQLFFLILFAIIAAAIVLHMAC